jgi:formylglycine-generating enzyme required for sulfatase activity/S1-C subfamily serine protease
MNCPGKVLVGLFIAAGTMGSTSSLYAGAGTWGFIGGAAKSLSEQLEKDIEMERQLEQQKRLMEHQHKLELQRIQQQREIEDQRRQEVLRLQKLEADEAQKRADEEKRRAINTGTGFFVAPNGYLVTNNHVIDDTTDYAIRDVKGRFYRAQLLARDPKHDLALLKVAGSFPSLRIVHSDTVSKGQRVFAVGYPQIAIQGNESKVTDGIISSFSGIRNDDDWFQISVPIQGGNSGGPLVTESGSVVGVVVASVNVSKFYAKAGTLPQNVNYAIKSKLVLDFLKAQGVKNTPSLVAKSSLEAVDSATAMVIAKNGPIDVAYTVSPEQTALDERARKQQTDEDARRRKVEEFAEKREQARIAADAAAEKRRLAAISQRDMVVKKAFPDWGETRQSEMFLAWMNEQTDKSSEMLESMNPADVMRVIRRFKAERGKFEAALLAREEDEHWRRVGVAANSATIRGYLDRYPRGRYVREASAKLEAIRKEEADLRPGKSFRDCADCPEMVVIPAGNFEMGSSKGNSDEGPAHSVRIGRPFAMGSTEVTQGQWRAVMGNSPSHFSNCGDDCPVEQVSWNDTKEFIKKLNAKTGKQYRLPSEAEWEYVCRAGGAHTYCGSDSLNSVALYAHNSGGKTHLAAGKQANAWGLYDMTGNVWEWMGDCWNANYSGAPSDGSAWTSGSCEKRVIRGGAWNSNDPEARATYRLRIDSWYRGLSFGFRLARVIEADQVTIPNLGQSAAAPSVLDKAESKLQPGRVFKDCADCPEMVIVPPGSFEMGSIEGESDEKPVHRVSITSSFALAKTEVTQKQWRSVMGRNPSQFSKFGDDHPVEQVNWHDAQEFVQKLSKKTGKVYRLPSEAEWEYACRAGGRQAYCGGDDIDSVAWIESNSGLKTHSVAGKQANAWGLFDMSGNVLEWTADCGNPNYSGAPTDGKAWSSGNCGQRLLRGGSWFFVPYAARATIRLGNDPMSRSPFFGLRPARELP